MFVMSALFSCLISELLRSPVIRSTVHRSLHAVASCPGTWCFATHYKFDVDVSSSSIIVLLARLMNLCKYSLI